MIKAQPSSPSHIRQAVKHLVDVLSETHDITGPIKEAAATLDDDDVLNATLDNEDKYTGPTAHLSPNPSTYMPYDNPHLNDRLNICRSILINAAFGRCMSFYACLNGVPMESSTCTHGCTLESVESRSVCTLLDMLGMCEADFSAFCAVQLDYPDGVFEVFSEKIRIAPNGGILAVAPDNATFPALPGQAFHYVDVSRFRTRTTFSAAAFAAAVADADCVSVRLLAHAYTKLLSDFQTLFGLDGPRGGSFLCSYFKARQGMWGSFFGVVRGLCDTHRDGRLRVRDDDGHVLDVVLKCGRVTVAHEKVGDTLEGQLATAVVQSWTGENLSVKSSALVHRGNLAGALSRLLWQIREEHFDNMMWLTCSVIAFEHGIEAEMALRDLRLYEGVVRRVAASPGGQEKLYFPELIGADVDMPQERLHPWWRVCQLLNESVEREGGAERVNYFDLFDWVRNLELVSETHPSVGGLQVARSEGWLPGSKMRLRAQCSFRQSMGSLHISKGRICFTHVPKAFVGVVQFMKRVLKVGVIGMAEVELAEHHCDEGDGYAGVLDMAISGMFGDSCALWALEAIYLGKVAIAERSPSSIKNCAAEFEDDGYVLEAIMPSRLFNRVAVLTDGSDVYAVVGSGLRCVKVVKKNEMMWTLEKAVVQDITPMKRAVLTGGRIVC